METTVVENVINIHHHENIDYSNFKGNEISLRLVDISNILKMPHQVLSEGYSAGILHCSRLTQDLVLNVTCPLLGRKSPNFSTASRNPFDELKSSCGIVQPFSCTANH